MPSVTPYLEISMSTAQVLNQYNGPTIEFVFTATSGEYNDIADFFGRLTRHELERLGYSIPHAAQMFKALVAKLVFAVSGAEGNHRFVMPTSAVTDLVDIMDRSEVVSRPLIDFRNVLHSLH
jgi:hypothetical protein